MTLIFNGQGVEVETCSLQFHAFEWVLICDKTPLFYFYVGTPYETEI